MVVINHIIGDIYNLFEETYRHKYILRIKLRESVDCLVGEKNMTRENKDHERISLDKINNNNN